MSLQGENQQISMFQVIAVLKKKSQTEMAVTNKSKKFYVF